MAVDEVEDRLSLVNRTFTSIAVVTPFPNIWEPVFPDAKLLPDSDTLDLQKQKHDLVIHAMCLHWANDPVGQLIQCRHALQNDGLFLGILLGGETLGEMRTVLAEAESRTTGGLSPRVVPMAEIRELGGLLQRTGLALPVADNLVTTAHYRDLYHLMHDLRDMGETNSLTARLRRPTRRSVFEMANSLYKTHYGTPDGRISASFELVCLTGWAPDESQPKPLRPGSASARLAEALKTPEIKLPD